MLRLSSEQLDEFFRERGVGDVLVRVGEVAAGVCVSRRGFVGVGACVSRRGFDGACGVRFSVSHCGEVFGGSVPQEFFFVDVKDVLAWYEE